MRFRCAICLHEFQSGATVSDFIEHVRKHGLELDNRSAKRLIDKWWAWQVRLSSQTAAERR